VGALVEEPAPSDPKAPKAIDRQDGDDVRIIPQQIPKAKMEEEKNTNRTQYFWVHQNPKMYPMTWQLLQHLRRLRFCLKWSAQTRELIC
jgi:hypothetical protein